MNQVATHAKRAAASLVIVVAFVAPAAAHAGSGAEAPRAVTVEQQHTEAATQGGGLDRRDGAAALAVLAGVLVMGLWGDRVVGAAIGAVAATLGAAARLATGTPRRGPGWSDWPGGAASSESPTRERVSRPAASASRSRRRSRRTSPSAPRSAR